MPDSGPTVLIVDDEPRDLAGLEKTLRSIRLKTSTSRDPHEVLQKVEADGPDLVILDALLPGMSGFDLCKQIKSGPATRNTCVVIITGVYLREHYRRDAIRQFKADGFVTKPYREKDLQRLVMRLLAKKLKTSPAALQQGMASGEGIFPLPTEQSQRSWLGRWWGRLRRPRPASVRSGFLHTAGEGRGATAPSQETRKETQQAPPKREEATPASPEGVGAAHTEAAGVGSAAEVAEEATTDRKADTDRADKVGTEEKEEEKAPEEAAHEARAGRTLGEPESMEQRAAELVGERKLAEARASATMLPTDVEEELWKAATMEPLTVGEPGEEQAPPRDEAAKPHDEASSESAGLDAAEAARDEPSGEPSKSAPEAAGPAGAPREPASATTLAEGPESRLGGEGLVSGKDVVQPTRADEAARSVGGAEAATETVTATSEGAPADLPICADADFINALRGELLRCKRVDRPLTLILVRVADLGQIVELFGKPFRPKVLRHVAIQAMESLREVDRVGLLTTKELLALTAFASGRYGGERIVNRLQATLGHHPFQVGEGIPSFIPKLRFGMAAYPKDAQTIEDLLERAEKEMEGGAR